VAADTRFRILIGGQLQDTDTHLDVLNPATEKVYATCPNAGIQELDSAVAAAASAFVTWSNEPLETRREAVRGMAAVIAQNKAELVDILVHEQGKSIENASQEVDFTSYFAMTTAGLDLTPTTLVDNDAMRVEEHYMPMGVVGAIAPWNYPLLLGFWKVFAAITAGNTVVLKPSPYTPLATLKAAEYLAELVPAGVLNVLSGGDELGAAMTAHDGIAKISFTGSSPTGKKILASAASSIKRTTLELGGNDAAIVLPDTDPKEVAERIFWSAFKNSGQICMAIKRLYVHEDIYDEMCDALTDIARTVVVGDGTQSTTVLGPVQNKMQFDKVCSLIDDVKKTSARFLIGGEVSESPGYFVPVSLVADAKDGERIVEEEAFGPVLPIIKFSDVDDVIKRANSSEFGLGGSVWTKDEKQGAALALRLECGTAWVNQHSVVLPDIPFGGLKNSGLGLEGAAEGLRGFCNKRIVNVAKS